MVVDDPHGRGLPTETARLQKETRLAQQTEERLQELLASPDSLAVPPLTDLFTIGINLAYQ